MKKFVVLAAVILMSSQSFAAITVKKLICQSNNDGFGYTVEISGGIDTHARNPNGTIGVIRPLSFQLVATLVSRAPNPPQNAKELTPISRDANGNYNFSDKDVSVVINSNMTQAKVVFEKNGATASCD